MRNPFKVVHNIAPNVTKLFGRPLSSHEIELWWDEPEPVNGILKPYEVFCKSSEGDTTTPINTTERAAIISNLSSNTEYTCTLKAGTYPDEKQNAEECETSVHSSPISTFDISMSSCHLHQLYHSVYQCNWSLFRSVDLEQHC